MAGVPLCSEAFQTFWPDLPGKIVKVRSSRQEGGLERVREDLCSLECRHRKHHSLLRRKLSAASWLR